MTRRDELLARIRKCLALAASANEHEAAAALAKARALMDEHGVDQADVDLAEVGEVRAKGGAAWTPPRWESLLAASVRRAMPVETIRCGEDGYAFVGLSPAPEIAAYAFTALFRQCKRARADYLRTKLGRVRTPRRKTARADAYAEGWAIAVYVANKKLYPERQPDDLVRGWLAVRYPNQAPLTPRSAKPVPTGADDRGRGWLAGSDVRLHHGVAGAEQLKLGR